MIIPLILSIFVTIIQAGSYTCCDKDRIGYVKFETFSSFLHERETIEQHFSYDNETDIYSMDKQATMKFNNNHYFWNDYYEPLEDRTKVCIYKLFKHHEELEYIIFHDGSQPSQVVFGCHSGQECCELGCCTIHRYFYFYFIYPSCIIMVILSYVARQRREKEQELRRALAEHQEHSVP